MMRTRLRVSVRHIVVVALRCALPCVLPCALLAMSCDGVTAAEGEGEIAEGEGEAAEGEGEGNEGEGEGEGGEGGGEGEGEPAPRVLAINEVMSANDATLADAAGNFGDWLEIHNLTDDVIALDDFRLQDSGSAPASFPSGTAIGARGFLVVFADDTSGGTPSEPHVPFKLSATAGDSLTIRTAAGAIVDTMSFPALAEDAVFGRFPDGEVNTETKLTFPTPGATNAQPVNPGEGEGEGEGEGGGPTLGDDLATDVGCAGVYNPDQLLDYELAMPAGDWNALKADSTNSVLFQATLTCGTTSQTVAVRRKRSGGVDKPGLKVDINELSPDQRWFGLRKLSLENGISEGSGDVERKDVIAEYLSWRMMVLSGAVAGRATFARVFVNGDLIGTYVNVEQVDKEFLQSRLAEDEGWLFKKSGSDGDGYKTNETLPNPFEDTRCLFEGNNACAPPPDEELLTFFPAQYDVQQLMLFGAVNALVANSDAPIIKDNNYYFYDPGDGAPRLYIPWDLDTVMKEQTAFFGGEGSVGGGTTKYTDVLFVHWRDDYAALLASLIEGPLDEAAMAAEVTRVVAVAGAALDADPAVVGDDAASSAEALETYWAARLQQAAAELALE